MEKEFIEMLLRQIKTEQEKEIVRGFLVGEVPMLMRWAADAEGAKPPQRLVELQKIATQFKAFGGTAADIT
ncbi:hypothetical protein DO97_14805 [Neosynechococcus sphagnicola sy1]|uniref:Uncharacterized protein n=1 Tax=Neosynechococcus sphagnicola sy1 TaxID=1497020 RepID=A0A098TIF6_9CYAN|nr:hypothetical protein [Neosynechococcus sphagnicola]KGF71894.1 hypothetical protein DO97_14805 [Neosynechococcus sphagnicola sy1]